MKKIAYQAPVIKTLTMEFIMAGGSVTAPEQGIGFGGEDDGSDPEAKDFSTHSVWDD